MTPCNGKTALVTGASRGIGRAAALALAKAGAQVLVHYGRNAAEARSVVDQIKAEGGRAEAVGSDLAAPDGAHKLAVKVRAIVGDRLDILVANAGVSKAATIEETTVEDFDALFAVNVRAPFFLVQQLLPILKEGSSVIFTSSLAAHAAVGNLSAYAATKGAIDTLVKHFALTLGARGIRVNAVAPGVVETDMSNFARTAAGRDFTLGMQALKRVAQPEDIAGSHRLPRFGRCALGVWRHAAGGRRLEALSCNSLERKNDMTERTIKIPGPDHPITIERNPNRVIVRLRGRVIADTRKAFTLREAKYPPVNYIPRADVDMAALTRSATETYCPYKGAASYFSIAAGGETSVDAIWTYETPYDAMAEIKDHLAFYPERVDAIEEAAA